MTPSLPDVLDDSRIAAQHVGRLARDPFNLDSIPQQLRLAKLSRLIYDNARRQRMSEGYT